MKKLKTNRDLLELLDKYWDEQGQCRSCSWHALVWEHEPELSDWDEKEQAFVFSCANSDIDEDERLSHGEIYIYPEGRDLELILQTIKK